MRLLFDFECLGGHIEEHFVSSDTREVECPHCHKPSHRIQSPIRSALDPISGNFKKASEYFYSSGKLQFLQRISL